MKAKASSETWKRQLHLAQVALDDGGPVKVELPGTFLDGKYVRKVTMDGWVHCSVNEEGNWLTNRAYLFNNGPEWDNLFAQILHGTV